MVAMLRLILAFCVVSLSLGHAWAAPAETILGEWTDTGRANRVVPYKIYIVPAAGPQPVVIFSHGLGGNRDGAEYLLRHLAENGFVAVAVQHPGSDTPAVMGELGVDGFSQTDRRKLQERLKNATSPAVAIDRFSDIPFAISELERMNVEDAALRGRMNLSRIGMSGHSYGAITTMALSGQQVAGGRFSFVDRRITASIAYSPSKPRQGDPAELFADIRIPTFHMTGTEDMNPLDDSEPAANRQIPYRHITGADKYLLVFEGGDHGVFSGRRGFSKPRPTDPAFQAIIQKASLAYWNAYLKDSAEAKAYLTGGAFAKDLGAMGTFEFRLK
jgi:predicted dienelactone hydrolase